MPNRILKPKRAPGMKTGTDRIEQASGDDERASLPVDYGLELLPRNEDKPAKP
jgi:hypothetical protein